MARSRKKTEVQTAAAELETLPPGATDFEPEEFESAAHAQEAFRASEHAEREFAAGHHHVENGERPKPQGEEHAPGYIANPSSTRREPSESHAAAVGKKKWVPPVNPFGYENQKTGENRVQLLKSESEEQRRRNQGEGAWVIRFEHNPNLDKGPDGEEYGKENPHPVLKMLKAEGFRWGFDQDDKGGWGKPFNGDAYVQDHIEAKRVFQQAADIIGHRMDHGRIPD